MNKLFKLIYVNLLSLFDINKIIIARSEGVKSNLEKRTIIMGIIAIVYAVIIFKLFSIMNLEDKYLILSVGYFISTIFCFMMNLFTIEPLILKSEDNDILFSYPLSRHQILFSKLFNVYLKNMFIVVIIMISSFISFYNQVGVVSDTQAIMGILSTLVIPFIPMVLATLISYVNDYFKLKSNNNYKYKLCKWVIILLVIIGLLLYFKDVKISGLNQGISAIHSKMLYLYPLINLFYNAIKLESLIHFIALIFIPIIIIYLYTLVVTNNYLRICSMLKGVKKKEKFEYKKIKNYGSLGGLIKKEFIYLFNNKGYLVSSFIMPFVGSIMLFIILNFVDIDSIREIENMDFYFNLYVPCILALLASLGCSTIAAMSLEKNNMQILRTLPIGMSKILFSKWVVNVIIDLLFVVINGSITWYYMNLKIIDAIFVYVIPLLAVMFISLTGLILDYRFIEKNETNDNFIIKQRLVTVIPPFISVMLGVIVLIFPSFVRYKILLGCYMLVLVIFMIIEIIYLLVQNKKLIRGLFN